MAEQLPVLLTVSQFSEKHPAFSEASLRWLIFCSSSNGLERAGVLKRLGRRVYLVEDKFFHWVDAQQSSPTAA